MTTPTDNPSPQTRYVLLNPGDAIQEGDECWHKGDWKAIIMQMVEQTVPSVYTPIRRADLAPAPPVSPGVKPMEWRNAKVSDNSPRFVAETPIGNWEVLLWSDGTFGGADPDGVEFEAGSLELAQSAAQADYTARILSALEPSALAAGQREAVKAKREALLKWCNESQSAVMDCIDIYATEEAAAVMWLNNFRAAIRARSGGA